MILPLVSLCLHFVQAPIEVKWEDLGSCEGFAAEVKASPNLHHAYWSEINRDRNQTRYFVDGKATEWFENGGMIAFTEEGTDWHARVGPYGKAKLLLNGNVIESDIENGFVLSVKPDIRAVKRNQIDRIFVDGTLKAEGPSVVSFLTPAGLICIVKKGQAEYELITDQFRMTCTANPDVEVMQDKSVLAFVDGQPFLNGKRVSGIPQADLASEVLISREKKLWALLMSSESEPFSCWINGKKVPGIKTELVSVPDQQFTARMLLAETVLDEDGEESAYKLFRVDQFGITPAYEKPVLAVSAETYVESSDGKLFGLIAETEEDKFAVIRNGSIVWQGSGPLTEATDLHGLAITHDGKRMAFVEEREQDKYYIKVNEQTFGPYPFIDFNVGNEASIQFSPDGKHFAFVADLEDKSKMALYVDGTQTKIEFNRAVQYGFPYWADSKTLKMMVRNDGRVYRVTAKLPE